MLKETDPKAGAAQIEEYLATMVNWGDSGKRKPNIKTIENYLTINKRIGGNSTVKLILEQTRVKVGRNSIFLTNSASCSSSPRRPRPLLSPT